MAGWYAIRRRSDGMWLAGCRKAVKANRGGKNPIIPSYQFSVSKQDAIHYKQVVHVNFMIRRVRRRFPKQEFEIIFEARV